MVLTVLAGCSHEKSDNSSGAAFRPAETATTTTPGYEVALPAYLRTKLSQAFKGDLDAMIKRRFIRVAAPYSRTFYYLDNGVQRGLSYEYMKLYEDKLNESLGKNHPRVLVILVPVPRDRLVSELNEGKVDMVAAQLTITPERSRVVDFTIPTRSGVNEIFVSGPDSSAVSSVDQLAGRTIFIRRSSSYFRSLQALDNQLRSRGKRPVILQLAPENLEDDDLLEMVNAGLIPATLVDNYLAQFWKQVFPWLVLSEDAPLNTGGRLAVAIRKGSPQLSTSLNSFIAQYGLSSAVGAVLNKRYLQSPSYVKNASSGAERKKFLALVDLFREYGEEYDFDYLLMAAQGYQESKLDQSARSPVGALGVMQLMPKTGQEQQVGDIRQLNPNIHAGVKYMSFMEKQYFMNAPMDRLNKELFTFAAYNAGPGRIRKLREESATRGLNPNVWFGNVEQVASERIGPETVTYVSNIFKYYIAYKLITEEQKRRIESRQTIVQSRPGRS